MPPQNVVAGPAEDWWTWWWSRFLKTETSPSARGRSSYEPKTAPRSGSAAKARRIRANASGWISMSASTNTSTSPDAVTRACVPGGRGTRPVGIPDDDQLLGSSFRDLDRVGTDRERGRIVRRRDDGCEREHSLILVPGPAEISWRFRQVAAPSATAYPETGAIARSTENTSRTGAGTVSRALIVTYHAIEPGPAPLCVHPDLFRAHVDAVISAGARAVRHLRARRGARPPNQRRPLGCSHLRRRVRERRPERGAGSRLSRPPGDRLLRRRATSAAVTTGPATRAAESTRLWSRRTRSQELVSAGFEIGSHGFEHLPVPEASGAALEREITGSKDALEQLTGTEVRSYAYPYGALPRAEVRSRVERTYAAACTTRVGLVGSRPDVHALPRVDAHYLRRPELLRRAIEGSLGPYLAARRFGAQARRTFRKDYVTLPAERTKH